MAESTSAFVFPGQGSQRIGMLSELAQEYPGIEETFAEASGVLDYDLWELCQSGEPDQINQTEVTQPLLLAASTAIWRLWSEQGGIKPAYLAGHSLGEWSALVASGVISFADGLKLVQLRGRYMQTAVPEGLGIMAAVMGLDDELIFAACEHSIEDNYVSPVNFNGPGQVVIAGHADAIYKATANCKEKGAKRVVPLPVSAPFHTPLMKPAADQLAADIEATDFLAPEIPIVHNVTVDTESDPAAIKKLMVEQMTAPVPWVATVRKLVTLGVTTTIECGPGKVLSGLNKRIQRSLATGSTETPDQLQAALAE